MGATWRGKFNAKSAAAQRGRKQSAQRAEQSADALRQYIAAYGKAPLTEAGRCRLAETERERMMGNSYRRGSTMPESARRAIGDAHRGKKRSAEWCKKIGDVRRITRTREEIVAAIETSPDWRVAAQKLGIGGSTFSRKCRELGIPRNYGMAGLNHAVVRVERDGVEDVFNLEVEQYHNFAANGVFVHNCAGVLDIFTEHALHAQETDEAQFAIETEDEKLRAVIEDVLDQLQTKDILWPITRDLVKFGDVFEEHVFTANRELVELLPLGRGRTFRTEDKLFPLEEKDVTGRVLTKFSDIEATHFRLRRSRTQEYGTSILAPVRKVYKQLTMMEDGMVVRRLTRATQRIAYIVPTGTMEAEAQRAYIQKLRDDLKKRRLVTADGKLSLREAPIFQDEDVFVAQPEGEKADVRVLQADGGLGEIGDVMHFLNRFFAGVKVPKAWLGFEADIHAKATLTEQAIAFARAARRVQLCVRTGFHHVIDSVLTLRGIDPHRVRYNLLLPAMSTVDEMRDITIAQLKANIAKIYSVDIGAVTKHYVLTKFLGLTADEAYALEQDLAMDAAIEAEAEAATAQQALAVKSANSQEAAKADLTSGTNAMSTGMPPATEAQIAQAYYLRQLTETARSLAKWSLEQRAYERALEPAKDTTVVYLAND
jgi:hypothetical protein